MTHVYCHVQIYVVSGFQIQVSNFYNKDVTHLGHLPSPPFHCLQQIHLYNQVTRYTKFSLGAMNEAIAHIAAYPMKATESALARGFCLFSHSSIPLLSNNVFKHRHKPVWTRI